MGAGDCQAETIAKKQARLWIVIIEPVFIGEGFPFSVFVAFALCVHGIADALAHFLCADFFGAFAVDIGGSVACIQYLCDSILNRLRFCNQTEGEFQQHSGGKNGCDGVCHILACDIGGGAMDGFVHPECAVRQTCGGQHPDRAGNLACLVGNNIPENIRGYNNIEMLGISHKLHCGIIHIHVV